MSVDLMGNYTIMGILRLGRCGGYMTVAGSIQKILPDDEQARYTKILQA